MNELPIGWIKTSLGSFTTDSDQRIPAETEVFKYIDIGSVNRNVKRIEEPQTLVGKDAPSRARKHVRAGDVLVSMTRPNLNAVALVPDDLDGQIASTGFDVLRVHEVDHRWVFNLVRSMAFVDAMSELVQGALYPAIRSKDIRKFVAPLAPLNEQKRIADKLDAVLTRVDACRDRLDRIPAIIKRFRQSVLAAAASGNLTQDWREQNAQPVGLAQKEVNHHLTLRREKQPANKKFKEPVAPDLTYWVIEVPDTWSTESISAFAECLDHMRIPVTRENRSNTNGLFPYYGANGLVDMVDEYLFDDELVLVTEDETFFGREKPIAYRSSGRCWVNNHAHVLLAGDRYRADYLCFALMYYNVLPWLTGTTGRAKLTQGVLNSLPIAVPPQIELEEIVRRVESLFAYADRLEARYNTARAQVEKLTPALLAKAFRGELVPQDPNDEPASELLARIRATKAEKTTKPKRGRTNLSKS